jgi:hypothetical protein
MWCTIVKYQFDIFVVVYNVYIAPQKQIGL